MLWDGIAVSFQYDIDGKKYRPLDKEEIVCEYDNGEIISEAGLDPADNT